MAGVLMRPLLLSWVGDAIASHAALAVATTLTGATHVRLVHGKSFRALVPQTLVSAPLAHAAMRAAHSLLGS